MTERVNEIYSLLIPLVDGRLIIPRACVAEVIGFQTPSEMTGAPPWYIGTVPWNGKAVPLVSFEGTCGQMIAPASGRTRVVILHALGTRVEGGNFALVAQGFPQLVRVSSDVVRPEAAGIICPQAPSKDMSGTALPFQGTVPMYQGGAPVISEGVWKPITSATQARGMMSRPSTSGTRRL